ncbi:glycosyltransferase family 2 protein [Pedobacter sp.]
MYSVIIATNNRQKELSTVIACLKNQIFKPENIIIIDSSDVTDNRYINDTAVFYKKVEYKSAAKQRNEGALMSNSEYVVFLDDDVEFDQFFFDSIFKLVKSNNIAICAPRQIGAEIQKPSFLLKLYYKIQSGYTHESYGGKLFGPGLNCYPHYSYTEEELMKVDWLPSTCLIIKRDVFSLFKFPNFDGYSFGEDVYLTASIGKIHPIYCFPKIYYKHYSLPTVFKKDILALNKMKLQNQKKIAKDILGLSGTELKIKMLLHRIFLSLYALKSQRNKLLYLRSIWQ